MYPQPPGTLFIIPILSYYIIFFALFYLFALFSNSKFTLLKLLFIAIFGLIITIPLTMTYFYFTKNVYVTREDEIKNNKVNSIASAKDSIKNTLGPNAKIKIIDDMVIGIIVDVMSRDARENLFDNVDANDHVVTEENEGL